MVRLLARGRGPAAHPPGKPGQRLRDVDDAPAQLAADVVVPAVLRVRGGGARLLVGLRLVVAGGVREDDVIRSSDVCPGGAWGRWSCCPVLQGGVVLLCWTLHHGGDSGPRVRGAELWRTLPMPTRPVRSRPRPPAHPRGEGGLCRQPFTGPAESVRAATRGGSRVWGLHRGRRPFWCRGWGPVRRRVLPRRLHGAPPSSSHTT